MSSFIDPRLSGLKAYVPGEQPKPGSCIKLNTNEFPYPPAKSVEEAALTALNTINLYSDLNCRSLKDAFKKVFGFSDNNVVFTNGSDEALYLCFLTFCGTNKGAAFADITYGFYSVYADLCGVKKNVIPLDESLSINPSDYYSLKETIFIANPNAPTGKKLSKQEIVSILESNKENIVVIDEAYTDFSGESCTDLLCEHKNLVIVGTFSKSRGMAGARLGYLISSEEIVADIEKVKFSINPYNVNSLTQAVGTAVLLEDDYYKSCISEICRTRDMFSDELRKLGFKVIPSYSNFVFAEHSSLDGKFIVDNLRKKGILIRHFNIERISNYVRITIGTPDQMNEVITALSEIIGG